MFISPSMKIPSPIEMRFLISMTGAWTMPPDVRTAMVTSSSMGCSIALESMQPIAAVLARLSTPHSSLCCYAPCRCVYLMAAGAVEFSPVGMVPVGLADVVLWCVCVASCACVFLAYLLSGLLSGLLPVCAGVCLWKRLSSNVQTPFWWFLHSSPLVKALVSSLCL